MYVAFKGRIMGHYVMVYLWCYSLVSNTRFSIIIIIISIIIIIIIIIINIIIIIYYYYYYYY